MRHSAFIFIFFVWGIILHSTAISAQNAKETNTNVQAKKQILDLTACYELSVQRSEKLGIRFQEYKAAEARYWQAISTVLPNIKFIAEERIQNNAFSGGGSSSPGGGTIGGGDNSSGRGRDAFTGRINLTQPIFRGFRDYSLIAAQKAQAKAFDLDYKRALQSFYYDVSDLFYQIISFERDLEVLFLLEKALQERVQELKERVEIGRSRKSELLQAQTQLADAAVLVEQTLGVIAAARELMAFLTGLPAGQFALVDRQPMPSADKLDTYLWKSGARLDIQAAAERQRAATKDLSARKGEFLPTIDLEANYYAVQSPGTDREWNVIITGEIPLFDGALRINRVREGKALVEQSKLSLSEVLRSSQTEVRTTYSNFISSINQYLKLERALRLSQENYELQKRDYELGRASNLDVLTALSNLYETRRRYINTELQAKVNAIALQVAAGEVNP